MCLRSEIGRIHQSLKGLTRSVDYKLTLPPTADQPFSLLLLLGDSGKNMQQCQFTMKRANFMLFLFRNRNTLGSRRRISDLLLFFGLFNIHVSAIAQEVTHWDFRCSNGLRFQIDLPETRSSDGSAYPGISASMRINGQSHTLFYVAGASVDNWIGTSGYSVHLGNRNGNSIAFKDNTIGSRCIGKSVITWQ